jgi:acyl carrier protein
MQGLITDLEDATQSIPGTVHPHTVLKTLDGWDSLAFVSFSTAVGARFGVTLSSDDLLHCETVGDLHALLMGKVTARAA